MTRPTEMPNAAPHVLIVAPGAKVALARALAASVAARGGTLAAWEADPYSPAALHGSTRVEGGPIENAGAAHRLLEWCAGAGVKLVVPTRHDDLPTLARVADLFAAAGITLALSSPECIDLCHDKVASHAWLAGHGFPVPGQTTVAAFGESPLRDSFPLVAKHPRGSGSRHLRVCHHPADLAGLPGDWILQTHAPGAEFTINTYVGRSGRSICEIPHERLMVGDGEVVRGRTARIPAIMTLARTIAEGLPGARGPLNIQVFWDAATGCATVIEINPRFGGGYPLAHEAGGRFTDWLVAEHLDGREPPRCDDWRDGLMMVRYREAAFFPPA